MRKLFKSIKGQQTAEYALLISLVVAAIIAMQTYSQRSLQARIRDASMHLVNETRYIGSTQQYEPYYLETDYSTEREGTTAQTQTNEEFNTTESDRRTRQAGGFQKSHYCDSPWAGFPEGGVNGTYYNCVRLGGTGI